MKSLHGLMLNMLPLLWMEVNFTLLTVKFDKV